MMWMGHVLDHMPDYMLDHMIIGLVTTALNFIYYYLQYGYLQLFLYLFD